MNICSICGQGFTDKSNFSRHLSKHNTENLFSCPKEQCDVKVKEKRYLKEHLKTHEETQNFSCTECDKSFTQKGSLKRHKQTVHQNPDIKFKCTNCLKTV